MPVTAEVCCRAVPVTAEVCCRTVPVTAEVCCRGLPVTAEVCCRGLPVTAEVCCRGLPVTAEVCCRTVPVTAEVCCRGLPVTAEVCCRTACYSRGRGLPVTAEVEGCLLQHKCAAELCLLQQQQWAVRATCYSRLCQLHQRCSRRSPVTKEVCRRTAPFEGYMLQQNIRSVQQRAAC